MKTCQPKQAAANPASPAVTAGQGGAGVRVVFLAVNASYSHRSLAAWCLRARLDESRVSWHPVEATIHDEPAEVLRRVKACAPDVVATTLYLFNTVHVQRVLAALRPALPECILVAGGPECLGDNRRLVPSVVDVAIRGEGEWAFAEWLAVFHEPAKWRGIPGVCCLADGVYSDNGAGRMLDSLDGIPAFYPWMLRDFDRPFVQLETSRGCPNGCLFCTSRRVRLRYKSMDRIRRDLADIHAAGIRDVRLVDRTFNLQEDRGLRLLEFFRGSYPDVRFHLEIDPVLVTAAFTEALRHAVPGQLHLEIGVQSLEPGVYPLLERKGDPGRVMEAVRTLCGMTHLRCHADLMAGLPGQTLSGLLEDVNRLVLAGPEEIQLERLKLLPGTPLAETPGRWGLTSSDSPPYAIQSTSRMGPGDLRMADRVAKILDWYHNKAPLREVFAEGVRRRPEFVRELCEHCEGRTAFSTCPGLEARLRLLDTFWAGRSEHMRHRVRYLWFRHGCSMRNGLCPTERWKAPVPEDAELVEGTGAGKVSRIWRVVLEAPHYFCFGRGEAGGRALVAVYRSRHQQDDRTLAID